MSFSRPLAMILTALALTGAGCLSAPPKPAADAPFFQVPKPPEQETAALPCLSFEKPEGFVAWIDAYAAGDEAAVALAAKALLPKTADPKLIQDMRASMVEGVTPSFVCILDDVGRKLSWITEKPDAERDTCKDTFYVSIDGAGTVSDLSVDGRATNCQKLCTPKRQDAGTLVWQCDLQKNGDVAAWTQLNMNRDTGTTEVVKCQKDQLGMPAGCVE